MKPTTQIAVAMKRAGVDTAAAQLHDAALTALRAHRGNADACVSKFMDRVAADRPLLRALALHYLREIAEDMKGLPGGATGRTPAMGQDDFAPSRQTGGDGVGHGNPATDGGHRGAARPSPRPPSKQRLAAMRGAEKAAAVQVWDTMEVRGRGPWRSLPLGVMRAIATEGTRDAAIATMILERAPRTASTLRTVEELIDIGTFQRFVQKAAEVVDREYGRD